MERPIRPPGPGEVQVRVEAVGICGSDMHSYLEGAVGDTPCIYPMVLGHEPAGTVVALGSGATGWQKGDRAAFEPALFCYHCEFCHSGRHNLCANLRFLSQPDQPGFFREYVNLPVKNLLGLPEGVGLREGALVEPLAVVLHSMQFVRLSPGETAAVFGCGPIGLLTIAALKLSGAGRIWAIEPVAHRRDMARAIGADISLDPNETDPVAAIWGETGKRGVDVAIDCATHGCSINQSIGVARNGGRVVFTGIPSELRPPLEFHPMRRKELALFNVRRSNHESDLALEMLRSHLPLFAPVITHTHPLEKIGEAFAQLEACSDGAGKIVLQL